MSKFLKDASAWGSWTHHRVASDSSDDEANGRLGQLQGSSVNMAALQQQLQSRNQQVARMEAMMDPHRRRGRMDYSSGGRQGQGHGGWRPRVRRDLILFDEASQLPAHPRGRQ